MKTTVKITFGALCAALAAVFTLAAYFPYVTYAAPALAGLMLMPLIVETDCKWAFGAYLVSALPVILFAEKEAMLLYVLFFGYYPIVKALTERMRKTVIEWIIKLAVFNAAMIAIYFLLSLLTDFSFEEFGILGKYGAYLFLAAGNAVFVLYDIAIARVASVYLFRLHPRIRRMLR